MVQNLPDDDLVLIRRYASSRDPAAFEGLALRYAPLVYSVAHRVTGSPHDAEDVAQECMLELARKAATIRSSVAGWLHALATSRAQNLIRGNRTRRKHEESAGTSPRSAEQTPWTEIEPVIDAALEALPDELRMPLVLHYLLGLSQSQVGQRLGLSQPTVSRRLEEGVARLRSSLGVMALTLPLSGLVSCLSHAQAGELPTAVRAAVGKMAIAGIPATETAAWYCSGAWFRLRGFQPWWLMGLLIPALGAVGYLSYHKDSTVQVSNVPLLRWGAYHDGSTTFVGAVAAAARASGKEVSYARLMGDSGLAFAVRWYRRNRSGALDWEGFPSFGDDHDSVRRMRDALQAELTFLTRFQLDPLPAARWSTAIRGSLERGVPVVAQDGQRARCCLIVGCDPARPDRLQLLHYGADQATWETLDGLRGLVELRNSPTGPRSRREAVPAAVRFAIADWTESPQPAGASGTSWVEPDGTRYHGERAWAEWMRDTERSLRLPPELAEQIWRLSWWNYDVFCDARYQASVYLRESTTGFPPAVRQHWLRAAGHYDRLTTEGLVDSVYTLPSGPWTQKTFQDWTTDVRRAELDVHQQVRRIDAAAIAELQAGLRLWDQSHPDASP